MLQTDSPSSAVKKMSSLQLPPVSSRPLSLDGGMGLKRFDERMSSWSPGPDDASSSSPRTPTSHSLQAIPTYDSALSLSTNFSSHLRASFRRAPADHTGELVRLMDDISTVTRCVAAYVAHQKVSHNQLGDDAPYDCLQATNHFYKSLCHDGYACLILDAQTEMPLSFPENAPNGMYVVTLTALDLPPAHTVGTHLRKIQPIIDDNGKNNVGECDVVDALKGGDCIGACGTTFAIFRRRSSPSVPGRLVDLQQSISEQVAAGYVIYSSATRLVYTLGNGAFSFSLHPVASQYFLYPSHPLSIHYPNNYENMSHNHSSDGSFDDSGNHTIQVFVDYSRLRERQDSISHAVSQFVRNKRARVFFDGCFAADFDIAMRCRAVIMWFDVHLLCAAAGMAFVVEQIGGRATNGYGKRILDMIIEDDDIHHTTTFLAGPKHLVDIIEADCAELSTGS